MKITTETITPQLAKEYLEKNKHNRRLSKRAVTDYANQIKKGNWKLNGDMIRFAEDGSLIDGQHRLQAVVEAETPVKMMVARDIEKEAIKTLDIGKKRSNADHLAIHGIQTQADLMIVSAAVRQISLFNEEGVYAPRASQYLSPTDTIDFVEANPSILHADERLPTSIGKFLPRSVGVALYYLFAKVDRPKADLFFVHLGEGADLSTGNPALTLRNKLLFMVGDKSNKSNKRQVIAYVCRAFNAFLNDEQIYQLRFDPDSVIRIPEKKLEEA